MRKFKIIDQSKLKEQQALEIKKAQYNMKLFPQTDLKGITFIIPLKGKSHNIAGLIQNLSRYDCEIIFVSQVDDKPFNKGALYNLGFIHSTTDIVIFADVDIRHEVKYDFIGLMESHQRPFVPFDTIRQIKDDNQIGSALRPSAWGGCAVFTRNQFEFYGGFSNRILHWGLDDALLHKRVNILRLQGSITHMHHDRLDKESKHQGFYDKNKDVFNNDYPKQDNNRTVKGDLSFKYKEGNITWFNYANLGNSKILINNPVVSLKPNKNKNYRVGAIYSTFYDLDMIEELITTINHVVDYSVLVHQKVGFNGSPEPEFNPEIIERLLKNKFIDEVIYYEGSDPTNGMIEKLNIGLEKVKQNKCDFVISPSADERYNMKEIKQELDDMYANDIDTLFMPIKAYYYDNRHYFIDTYYSEAIHKVDDRVYERTASSYLCDPQKKMIERKSKLSPFYIHHYSFIKDNYASKLINSIRCITVFRHRQDVKDIYERLQSWKEGDTALVFGNDMSRKGKVVLMEKELTTIPLNKIAILIPFWKRHSITDFTFNYYNKLKDELASDMELILICVGSEKSTSMELAEKNNFNYIEYPNTSIQLKHDAIYTEAKKYNPDACLKIDSDTIVSKEFFYYWNLLVQYGCDYSEVLDIYFMFQNGVCYWNGYDGKRQGEGTGVGRFTSKNLLNLIDWKIIGGNKQGVIVDYYMTQRIKNLNIVRTKTTCVELRGKITELKSDIQLTDLTNAKFDYTIDNSFCEIDISPIKDKLYINTNITPDLFSVIIPTMWHSDYIFDMLEIYEDNDFIKEVIIIDNNPYKKQNLSKFKKVKSFTKGENIYVNPAWNWGASLASSKYLIIANDDILFDKDDFSNLLLKSKSFLKPNIIIGAGEYCFKQKGLKLSELSIDNAKSRNWGFGTFMIMKKRSYTIIPDNILLWCGDDILFETNTSYTFNGIEIKTPMGTTLKAEKLRNIAKEDIERASKYDFSKLPKLL